MPLPLPNLDDRTWPELVDEGMALVPRFAPAWTDHNIHDPGRTLAELFAWLTEMDIYRLNRVPERHRRKFLALTGFLPAPPRAARVFLNFTADHGIAPFVVPAGAEFGSPPFRTTRDVTVSVVTLAAVQVEANAGVFVDRTRDFEDGLPIELFGPDPQPGAAFYLGFSALPSQSPVALAFRLRGPGVGADEKERIIKEAGEQAALCRRVLPDIHCGEPAPQPAAGVPPHHSARIAWEAFTGAWMGIDPALDETRSLTLDGMIEMTFPPTTAQTPLGSVSAPLFYLRARLESGAFDAPPVLMDAAPNSVVAEQAVPVSETFRIAVSATVAGTPPAPGSPARLNFALDAGRTVQSLTFLPSATPGVPDVALLAFDAPSAPSQGAITLEFALGGTSNGRPTQRFALPCVPVQIESIRLYTHLKSEWQEWTRREDFDSSTRTDFHYVLNPTTGEVNFGDGERGRVPLRDSLILGSYRSTTAEEGNVPAGTVNAPAESARNTVLLSEAERAALQHRTHNCAAAFGGAAQEALAAATARVVDSLHAHSRLLELAADRPTLDQLDPQEVRRMRAPTRGVNLPDLERLALDVPGTRVARARAWGNTHPDYPCLQASGIVTVVILPDMAVRKPVPSAGLIAAVKRFLDRRRIVCTRVEVRGPEYLEVGVNARVRARGGAERSAVLRRILQTVNQFLDPLAGGPDGRGWPFGRDVYRSEILQLLDSASGVDHVLSLTLRSGEGPARCGDLALCPGWLTTPGSHEIEVV
jgi:hypothetical protein